MPQIEIISEQDHGKGWQFVVQVLDDSGTLRQHALTMSWADYNLWSSDGADEPAKVAEAVIAFLVTKSPAGELQRKFDASIVRRRYPDADAKIPGLIAR